MPKVVLCQTLNCHWKELFCMSETEKCKAISSTLFYTSLVNLHKKAFQRCYLQYPVNCEKLIKFQ